MARSVNKVFLLGNLGKDPELRYTASGTAVATCSLATSRSRKDANDQWHDETEWHRIVCWERIAETVAQHCHKGSKVFIEGRIQSRQYTDNQGQQRTSFEIVVNDLTLCDSRTTDGEGQATATAAAKKDAAYSEEDFEDVPF